MRYSDIQIGGCYLFDKDNTGMRIDGDINVVKVVSKTRGLFRAAISVYPIVADKGECPNNTFVISKEEILSEMNSNPAENVIIRYPSDIPVFSDDDCAVMAKAFKYALDHINDSMLTEAEVLKMSAIVQKVKFYATISEKYRPTAE